jgi:hypothetical protein
LLRERALPASVRGPGLESVLASPSVDLRSAAALFSGVSIVVILGHTISAARWKNESGLWFSDGWVGG